MSEAETLTYSDEYINKILGGPSLLGTKGPLVISQKDTDISNLEILKKKLIRTELHAKFLTDCLNANIIPVGLQVKNIPIIFTDDDDFKIQFSFSSNKCSRTWMVLSIDTALKHLRSLKIQIDDLTNKIVSDQTIGNAKQALENLEASIRDFEKFNITKKTDKLQKDIKRYNKERTYPYLKKDFYHQNTPFGFPKKVTFSDTASETDSDSSRSDYSETPSTSRQDFLEQGSRGYGQRPRRRGGRRIWSRNQYTPGFRRTRNQYYEW